ncbi:MAG: glycosyltransferase [Verrucomicrobiota bacterium]
MAIIPTAGNDPERLRRCLDSLRMSAAGLTLHPVVVLCPASIKRVRVTKSVCAGRAQLVSLPGPFNYCRSINEGLLQRRPGDGYALFLNDDVTFREPGDLARMKQTLREQHWACVGPHIEHWHGKHSRVKRGDGAVRTNEPVNGCCALWELDWLDRLGPLDEEFGRGWGLDEADLCLRALRLGARYGREDRVSIEHVGHATFGTEYADCNGDAHQRNVRHFRRKYGSEVGLWGQTHHWEPLPGVQVSIAAHNAAPWLGRCLDSVEQALDGFRWTLFLGDDCSSDETFEIALAYQSRSGADVCHVRRFQRKAMTVDQAKNRVIRMGMPYRRLYPAMCLMDADDVMAPGRVRHLLWQARDGGHRAVLGDYLQITPHFPARLNRIVRATPRSQIDRGFGPWATLFHSSLVPRNARLFREHREQVSNGDVDLWVRWFRRGIDMVPFPGEVVHHYYLHEGSVSRPQDPALARQFEERWRRRKARLLGTRLSNVTAQTYATP